MNIHEHQAKEILREFGAPTTDGLVIFNTENLIEKIKTLNSDQFVLKAQIHAGGRGKAGGVKLVKKEEIVNVAQNLFGKVLVTPQTGPEGRKVKRIYVQIAYDIFKESKPGWKISIKYFQNESLHENQKEFLLINYSNLGQAEDLQLLVFFWCSFLAGVGDTACQWNFPDDELYAECGKCVRLS